MNPLIAVVGATASGKTSLAVALAQLLETDILSADSMQAYRGMEIGTAAPTPEEQARATHHFVSFLDPAGQFTAGAFGEAARAAASELWQAGKTPVAAGGSGLYVRALVEGLFAGPAADPSIRARLQAEAESIGTGALYTRLQSVDPSYARIILPGDLRRIVRALEVYELTGEPLSHLHQQGQAEPLPALQIALDVPRGELYARIDARVDRMLEAGFLDEVQRLLDAGYRERLLQLRTLGYPEFTAFLEGRQSYDEARALMQRNTRRFARRQLSWWRGVPGIHWLPPESTAQDVLELWHGAQEETG